MATKHIFSDPINTHGEFVLLETAINKTFTVGNTYTIQCLQPANIRIGDEVPSGNPIDSPHIFVQYEADGSDVYIKTMGNTPVVILEKTAS